MKIPQHTDVVFKGTTGGNFIRSYVPIFNLNHSVFMTGNLRRAKKGNNYSS